MGDCKKAVRERKPLSGNRKVKSVRQKRNPTRAEVKDSEKVKKRLAELEHTDKTGVARSVCFFIKDSEVRWLLACKIRRFMVVWRYKNERESR